MAEPFEQRAGEQCVDLVVLGDQDRQGVDGRGRDSGCICAAGDAIEALRLRADACGLRSGPERLDQIAGEASRLQGRQFVALGRRDQHDAARHRGRRGGGQAPAGLEAKRVVDQHRVEASLRQRRGEGLRIRYGAGLRAPLGEAGRHQRGFDCARGGDQHRGWLSTAMRPPMPSMMRLEMASPRPVPE
jgi:hypothetical protein